MRILIVEDDPSRTGLADLLAGAGHAVEWVNDGLAAAARGIDPAFDVILVDLALPKLDGVEVCRRIRRARPDVPILMLTAHGSEDARALGRHPGIDDYVAKPFGAKELLERLASIDPARRGTSPEPELIEIDGLRLDLGRCQAHRGRRTIPLSTREVGILRWLHRHRDRAVTRAELLEHVWGIRAPIQTRTVDLAIDHLRRKLERVPSRPRLVRSVKGIGYAWGGA